MCCCCFVVGGIAANLLNIFRYYCAGCDDTATKAKLEVTTKSTYNNKNNS